MDDPWSTNAWSTEDDKEVPFQINRLEWETSEHDVELNSESGPSLPPSSSWSIPSGSAWDVGNDVWTSGDNTSYNETWNPKESESTVLSTQTVPETSSDKPADLETIRPALPTPPSSPLAIPSRVVAPEIETPEPDVDVQTLDVPEPSEVLTTLATPGFGSFESAQEEKAFASSDGESFWPKEPAVFETDNSFEEPWKSTWDSPADEDAISDSQPKDDWEVAQDTQRKLNERIPQELLRLIISRWEAIAEEHYSQYDLPGELDYSWRKGLDNVPGLSERLDDFIPSSYFSLPTPFPKSEIAKTVKESLRLTRFYALSQSSPMTQFYASKGSTEWENSVKMQKLAANDEWGWDLKQGQEDTSESQEAAAKEPEKRGSGFLSFWKRRTPSESTIATSNTQPEVVQPEKKEQTPVGPTPPTSSSLRPSLENPSTPTSSKIPLESTVSPSTEMDNDQQQIQPSVVSRFFNRLSRRPASGIIVETTEDSPSKSSVSLSADDLAFLSDIAPSDPKPKSNPSIYKASGEALSFNTAKKDQLPAPLPPPPASSHSISPATEGLKNKVNKKGVDAFDLLGDDLMMGSPLTSSSTDRMPHSDRANLLFQDISIFENKSSTTTNPEQKLSRMSLDLPLIPSPSRVNVSTPPNLRQPSPQPFHLQPRASSSSSSRSPVLKIPPPPSKVGLSKPPVSHSVVPSIPPPGLDDFSDFISSNPIKSTTVPLSTPAFGNDDMDDFGDFGDFVSTGSQFSHQHGDSFKSTLLQSNPTPQVDFRGTSSVTTIPILKPPPKFTSVGSDFIGRTTEQNRVRSPPLSGKSSPLPQVPLPTQFSPPRPPVPSKTQLRPPQVLQQSTNNVFLSSSIGQTAPTSSSTKKSGLSAQDLSFFEGL